MKKMVFLVFGAGMFLSACSGTSLPAPTPTPTPQAELNTPPVATSTPVLGDQAAAKSFTVTGSSYSFDPKEIRVKKGETVKITFRNTEGFHDWKLDEFNAATKRIKEGEEDTVTFTADRTGTFEYYCSVGTHRAMGMVGKLIVE